VYVSSQGVGDIAGLLLVAGFGVAAAGGVGKGVGIAELTGGAESLQAHSAKPSNTTAKITEIFINNVARSLNLNDHN
jgi:hypothetical protein